MKVIPYLVAASICLGCVAAILPVIKQNTDDPNLVAYFDHDEGFLMDLGWYYYSGQKRASFQYEADYGVELLYIAAFCRLVLTRFMDVTPVTIALILRWLNMVFWVASLVALWRLIERHFGGAWEAVAVVGLLAVRPALAVLTQSSKPDAVTFFFIIVGLDYCLRIFDAPSYYNVSIAIVCAAIAALIKFAGIFLVPAIAAALYLTRFGDGDGSGIFKKISSFSWVLPGVCGFILVSLPLAIIFFYVRQSTGLTWYDQFGFQRSILSNHPILYSMIAGILLIIITPILRIYNPIRRILSSVFFVSVFFFSCALLFGIIWVFNPSHLIQICASTVADVFRGSPFSTTASKWFFSSLSDLLFKIRSFDMTVFYLFILSAVMTFHPLVPSADNRSARFHKRTVLIIFVLIFTCCMLLNMRLKNHHMMPFFTAAAIVIAEELRDIYGALMKNRMLLSLILCAASGIFVFDIIQNLATSAKYFSDIYHRDHDIVFEIAGWWRNRYPPNVRIAADHPTRAYIPPEYVNARFLEYKPGKVDMLRKLVDTYRPDLLYYNTKDDMMSVMPPVQQIFPGKKIELAASFCNAGRRYQRFPNSEFVIYKIAYER